MAGQDGNGPPPPEPPEFVWSPPGTSAAKHAKLVDRRRRELLERDDLLTNEEHRREFAALTLERDQLLRSRAIPRSEVLIKPASDAASFWDPYARSPSCMSCMRQGRSAPFSALRKKIHCSHCGDAVCKSCSTNRVSLPSATKKPLRVCDRCHEMLRSSLAPIHLRCRSKDDDNGDVHWVVELPACLWQYRSLCELDLSDNALEIISPGIGNLLNLKSLNLEKNALMTLPKELGHLEKLESLFLNHNKLTELPATFARLSSLRKFEFAHNELPALPLWLRHLDALELLDASHNPVREIDPRVFQGLPSLLELRLDFISCRALPISLGGLPSLETLSVQNGTLEEFVPLSYGAFPKLCTLNLANNELTAVPEAVTWMSSLETLTLDGNSSLILSEDISRIGTLKYLGLASCALSALPHSLGMLRSLQELNLVGNNLTALPPSMRRLAHLDTLQYDQQRAWVRPPVEVLAEGVPAVRQYFELLVRDNLEARCAIQVLCIGEAFSGKTALCRAFATREPSVDVREQSKDRPQITIDSSDGTDFGTPLRARSNTGSLFSAERLPSSHQVAWTPTASIASGSVSQASCASLDDPGSVSASEDVSLSEAVQITSRQASTTFTSGFLTPTHTPAQSPPEAQRESWHMHTHRADKNGLLSLENRPSDGEASEEQVPATPASMAAARSAAMEVMFSPSLSEAVWSVPEAAPFKDLPPLDDFHFVTTRYQPYPDNLDSLPEFLLWDFGRSADFFCREIQLFEGTSLIYLLTFDLTSPDVDSAQIHTLIHSLATFAPRCLLVLVGTKADLCDTKEFVAAKAAGIALTVQTALECWEERVLQQAAELRLTKESARARMLEDLVANRAELVGEMIVTSAATFTGFGSLQQALDACASRIQARYIAEQEAKAEDLHVGDNMDARKALCIKLQELHEGGTAFLLRPQFFEYATQCGAKSAAYELSCLRQLGQVQHFPQCIPEVIFLDDGQLLLDLLKPLLAEPLFESLSISNLKNARKNCNVKIPDKVLRGMLSQLTATGLLHNLLVGLALQVHRDSISAGSDALASPVKQRIARSIDVYLETLPFSVASLLKMLRFTLNWHGEEKSAYLLSLMPQQPAADIQHIFGGTEGSLFAHQRAVQLVSLDMLAPLFWYNVLSRAARRNPRFKAWPKGCAFKVMSPLGVADVCIRIFADGPNNKACLLVMAACEDLNVPSGTNCVTLALNSVLNMIRTEANELFLGVNEQSLSALCSNCGRNSTVDLTSEEFPFESNSLFPYLSMIGCDYIHCPACSTNVLVAPHILQLLCDAATLESPLWQQTATRCEEFVGVRLECCCPCSTSIPCSAHTVVTSGRARVSLLGGFDRRARGARRCRRCLGGR
eukprot:m.17110 g.17110  ORF g.17110 m.17110 type:complete len:1364 (+) comp3567_c0_seq2:148-4239(+)